MKNKYLGFYYVYKTPEKYTNLEELKSEINSAIIMDECEYYTTAYIQEFNVFNRVTKYYYFSLKYNGWICSPNSILDYISYYDAVYPVKQIMQWLIKLIGLKRKQENKIKLFTQKINEQNK